MPPSVSSRRAWLARCAVAGAGAGAFAAGFSQARAGLPTGQTRAFHVCLSPAVIAREPDLLDLVRDAGAGTVWLADYFYGHRPFPAEQVRQARALARAAGLEAELINIPLGHPGDSLGSRDGDFPLTPPPHWSLAQRPDGTRFAGTSLHEPATRENAAALREQRRAGFRACFLDDDFRLARGPGEIGGCACAAHREAFLRAGGWSAGDWEALLDAMRNRRLTGLVRAWLEFHGRQLTASFREQRRAFCGDLGIMVMYLGAEKAGIRLADYRRVPFRVGELMFDDRSFGTVKGKTDELFSVLFHRRFADPERAYSETTAFPADRLSARHLAAKLVVSTVADVRHTMFMSGLTPFPRTHWAVLAPEMRRQAALHREIAGHSLRGPFRHCWGEAERCVGDDRPFSLWLALGIPFEVGERPADEGWSFLSDHDAAAGIWGGRARGGTRVCRVSAVARARQAVPGAAVEFLGVEESFPALWAFKRSILPRLGTVPHLVDDAPAVCAWYPTAGRVLVWNLGDEARTFTLRHGARTSEVRLEALASTLVPVPRGRGDGP